MLINLTVMYLIVINTKNYKIDCSHNINNNYNFFRLRYLDKYNFTIYLKLSVYLVRTYLHFPVLCFKCVLVLISLFKVGTFV